MKTIIIKRLLKAVAAINGITGDKKSTEKLVLCTLMDIDYIQRYNDKEYIIGMTEDSTTLLPFPHNNDAIREIEFDNSFLIFFRITKDGIYYINRCDVFK